MNCEECKAVRAEQPVPYLAHESAMARSERKEKRLIAVIFLLIILLVVSNCIWILYEAQFETIETVQEVTQDAEDGTNNFVGGDYNGTADGEDYYAEACP